MQDLALGVDIGGTKVLTALVCRDGKVLREWVLLDDVALWMQVLAPQV